jgi:hypothetical protein
LFLQDFGIGWHRLLIWTEGRWGPAARMSVEKKQKDAVATARKARLAAELRANLLKRKAQARERKVVAKAGDEIAEKD